MGFVNILTYPLENRSGTESSNTSPSVEDGAYLEFKTIILREEKHFPEWWLYTDSQKLVLNSLRQSNTLIDKITKSSVRPPELI